MVIWDGDPLELTTFADAVFVRGREIPMTSRQTELRDRYKDLKQAAAAGVREAVEAERP